MRYCLAVLYLALTTMLAGTAHAIVNGEQHLDNRQLDAVGAFSKSAWIGVQVGASSPRQDAHNYFGAATLISPRHIITARHLLPKNGPRRSDPRAVRFRRNPDGSVGTREQGAQSFYQVQVTRWIYPQQGGDIVIGVLEHEVTHIEPMPVLLDVPERQVFAGWVAGWGSYSRRVGASGPREHLLAGPNLLMRVGQGVQIGWFETFRRTRKTEDGREEPVGPTRVKQSHFAVPNVHDSGGALLAVGPDGRFALVGVISTYRGGTWLGRYAQDAEAPLSELASDIAEPTLLQFVKVQAEAEP